MKQSFKTARFWLHTNLICLIIFYLTLIWKTTESIDAVVTNSLFWGVIYWRLWQNRKQLNFHSDPFSIIFGLILLAIVLYKSIFLFWFESSLFLPFTTFFALFGLLAIAFGLKQLKQYWLELLLASLLFMPSDTLGWWFNQFFHLQLITAKFTNYLLYYLGFNTISRGHTIILWLAPNKYYSAVVNYACTGTSMIMLMFKLALCLESCVVMKPLQRLIFPIAAIVIGFLLGSIRVSIMTILLPEPNKFNYWHGAEGAQIFSTLAIFIFSSFCYLLLQKSNNNFLTKKTPNCFPKSPLTPGKH